MQDEAHVRLVDAHAKGDRRADDGHVIARKRLLVPGAFQRRETGVVRKRLHAVVAQPLGERLGAAAAVAVDDPALVRPRSYEVEHLRVRALLGNDAVCQVRPVKAADMAGGVPQFQIADDIRPHTLRRRRGQRHQWDLRHLLPQRIELAVLRPEVVAPFADAVRLVDGDEAHVPAQQRVEEAGHHYALRRDVQDAIFA